MKYVFLLYLFVVAIACVGSFSEASEEIEKEIMKDKNDLKLKSVGQEVKGGGISYAIPYLHRKSLTSVIDSGLLMDILSHGAKVCFEFQREEVDKNEIKKMSAIGSYIVSVKPKIFKPGDTIVISVNNIGIGN
jgi:hypothetical protein